MIIHGKGKKGHPPNVHNYKIMALKNALTKSLAVPYLCHNYIGSAMFGAVLNRF